MAELVVEQIAVRFGGIQALNDVDVTVSPGTVHGLIGPNGAGKTTLFNVITGLQPPSRGRVRFDGEDITGNAPHIRARLGMARTFQRLELFDTLTARENVQMAAETQRRRLPPGMSPDSTTQSLLEQVGIAHVADEPTDSLPTGLARLVELARAMATTPTVLLLDEPSAGLNQLETEALGKVLVRLASDGMAVLLVEHDMSLVMSICDQVTVLHYGEIIATGNPAAVQADPAVQAAYLGTETPAEPTSPATAVGLSVDTLTVTGPVEAGPAVGGGPVSVPDDAAARSGPMLELVDVRAAYGRIEVVHGVSLTVPRGAVLALLGPNGAGKSTLLRVTSGRMSPSSGTVRFHGEEIGKATSEQLARRGLCAIPEGRAVFPNLTVAENLLMYTYRGKDVKVADLEEQSYIRFPVLGQRRRQLAGRLSGGEQQMLALARALYTNPRLLLLDEISMGLAPLVVAELYELVSQLVASEVITVLLVEQFAQTALTVADHVAVMVNGRIVRSGTPAEVGDNLMSAYMGGDQG
ncbi:MAG TPA: ATP-binding cassette domain-containing protein [Acidimicrobiales bacterium]|nr:ATP-binding cassette domain-containing protein [Acidimicrobiales bacterium]